jgi:hypothetical protein
VPNPPENSVQPATRDEWRAWLAANHARPEGVWLVSYRKAAGKPRVDYEAAVEEALCFGWIDSKGGRVDDERTMLWMAPRKPGTGWSRLNKERIERLAAEGRIEPPGMTKIDAAKADGSWTLLDSSEALEVPADPEQARRGTFTRFRPPRERPSCSGSASRRSRRRAPPASTARPAWRARTSAPTRRSRSPVPAAPPGELRPGDGENSPSGLLASESRRTGEADACRRSV